MLSEPPIVLHLPPVLVPGLDLRVGEGELCGELHAVLHAQVLLPLEAFLERLQLVVGEGGARLALLLGGRRLPVAAPLAAFCGRRGKGLVEM